MISRLMKPSAVLADSMGIAASLLCAIHCAAMPLVMSYLPSFSKSWLAGSSFHGWMAGVCFLLAAMAFAPAWRIHRRLGPVIAGLAGVGLLTAGSFIEAEQGCSCCDAQCSNEAVVHEAAAADSNSLAVPIGLITPLGGVLLLAGHVTNHRCRSGCCRQTNL